MPRRTTNTPKSVELDRSRGPLILATLLFVGLGITAGAIAWGRSDAGQINVAATINNSSAQVEEPNGETAHIQAATQEHSNLPNGGLVSSDGSAAAPAPEPTPAPEETASTSATTTAEGNTDASVNGDTEANVTSATPAN